MHFRGEYSDCYGNGGCDGFAPYFPLIRMKRNRSIILAELPHAVKRLIHDYHKKAPFPIRKGAVNVF